ncbi:MAG: hypothetical protein IJP02_05400 [Oscillospiraceae bacterium]|nr:hypothetical protein [Oscillospiraceae bacterium]
MPCSNYDTAHLEPYLFNPRPGAQPYVSPEGLICSTDGKCRWVYQAHPPLLSRMLSSLLPRLGPGGRSILFTLDEESICVQRLQGRLDRQRLFNTVSKWTGGQSHPSIRFDRAAIFHLRFVTDIVCQPEHSRIRLDGGEGIGYIYAHEEALDCVYTLLTRQQQLAVRQRSAI